MRALTAPLLVCVVALCHACGGGDADTTSGAGTPDAGGESPRSPDPDAESALPLMPPVPETAPLEPADARLDDALQRIVAQDHDAALDLARAVLAERPDSARAAFLAGLSLHKQKNYGAALPYFDDALRRGPTFEPFAPVHYFRAWCLYNLGDLRRARAGFERHLELQPDEGDSHFALGLIATDEGRYADAERELHAAYRNAEDRVRAGDNRRREDAAKARARLADVILAQPTDDPADALARARAELEAAVQIYPPHYTTWFKLHQVLLEQGDEARAAEALRQHDSWKEQVRPGSQGLGG